MAKDGNKMYIFSGYSVFPWVFSENDEYNTAKKEFGWKWYTTLKSENKSTRIGFASLVDARKWCKQNYLLGIAKGWIKA